MTRTFLLLAALTLGCAGPPARNLDELVALDSSYLDPSTLLPFTGDVFKLFEGTRESVQLRGTLRDGTWQGELTVYHRNGRVRFQGDLVDGAQCGAWTENVEEEARESLYEELVAEIENLSLYPPCPD